MPDRTSDTSVQDHDDDDDDDDKPSDSEDETETRDMVSHTRQLSKPLSRYGTKACTTRIIQNARLPTRPMRHSHRRSVRLGRIPRFLVPANVAFVQVGRASSKLAGAKRRPVVVVVIIIIQRYTHQTFPTRYSMKLCGPVNRLVLWNPLIRIVKCRGCLPWSCKKPRW